MEKLFRVRRWSVEYGTGTVAFALEAGNIRYYFEADPHVVMGLGDDLRQAALRATRHVDEDEQAPS